VSPGDVTEHDLDRVGQLLEGQIGLRPDPSMRGRLRRCLRDEAASHREDLRVYLAGLLPASDHLRDLIDRVTVQESGFFRHPEQFEVLARDVFPALTQPVRIWSAGCANGQEPFSLAMLLKENGVDGSVIATDQSTSALGRTAAAQYRYREIGGLSEERRSRHLTPSSGAWGVKGPIRDRVEVVRHNLIDPIPDPIRSCQVVFCRNVLIYLGRRHIRAFLDRLADNFPEGHYLFLGASETIWEVTDRFESVRAGDVFFYRLAGRDAPSGEKPRPPAVVAPRPAAAARRPPLAPPDPEVAHLARQGQAAVAAGDHEVAVVAFRKWVYLAPDDAISHLHLGLALEARGDPVAAGRAFAAARGVLLAADPAKVDPGIEGYATTELLRLLESKRPQTGGGAVTP
jgi:chemotaxis protein methyltransferase CheR